MKSSESPIREDEVVTFFPTYGFRDGANWRVHIHGWIYEPVDDSLVGRALLGLLRRSLKLERGQIQSRLFKERVRPFLVDNARGKRISICHGEDVYELPKSGANGHFEATVSVPSDVVKRQRPRAAPHASWFVYQAVTLGGSDGRDFTGKVQLIPNAGLSVITDLDDTIKETNVSNRGELLANTFLREFRAVDGMANVYRRWEAAGAAFHYVSASPWQLYAHLSLFLSREAFPEGSMHLRLVRFKDSTALELLSPPDTAKEKAIRRILGAYPGRSFVMVGDSSENDPELYGRLAGEFPGQVCKVFIRRVTGESAGPKRLQAAFDALPTHQWQVFDDPCQLPDHPLAG